MINTTPVFLHVPSMSKQSVLTRPDWLDLNSARQTLEVGYTKWTLGRFIVGLRQCRVRNLIAIRIMSNQCLVIGTMYRQYHIKCVRAISLDITYYFLRHCKVTAPSVHRRSWARFYIRRSALYGLLLLHTALPADSAFQLTAHVLRCQLGSSSQTIFRNTPMWTFQTKTGKVVYRSGK